MRIVSWNVNGLRSCIKKGFWDFIQLIDADFICVQELRAGQEAISCYAEGYEVYANSAFKPGYAGTAVFSRIQADNVCFGLRGEPDEEGRVITLEYPGFHLVNCYSPHSRRDLSRLKFKQEFDQCLINHVCTLDTGKPTIICGDLNIAHEEIDIRNAKQNIGNAGFTDIERTDFSKLLRAGYVDAFRYIYPDRTEAYTWWSYMKHVRERNIGWRIDYFIVSKEVADRIEECQIHKDIMGSDHCPISLEIYLEDYT